MSKYTIGLDFGTNSVRSLLLDLQSGSETSSAVYEYRSGAAGVLTDPQNALVFRQDPHEYVAGARHVIQAALSDAAMTGVTADQIVGVGVDTTGSTPIPVDGEGRPLAMTERFKGNLHAMAVLWKDHTAHAEAAEITDLAARTRPHFLARCGGVYSSEWFWAKILYSVRHHPEIFEHTATWIEHADWQPALFCDRTAPDLIRRGICAAGHKGLYSDYWGGYPDVEFLSALDPRLVDIRASLPSQVYPIGQPAGRLSAEWARLTGLMEGVPVSVGGIDAHLGAVGAGISAGALVKIIGTSSCDIMIAPLAQQLPGIKGLCGVVPESVLPGYYGLEAGQAAVGDIFNWFVNTVRPGGLSHRELTAEAEELAPGESGLLALDWHNGNRTVLVDQRLSGTVVGLTLQTKPAELYRAWVEATAFGARKIVERLEESGQKIERVVVCGGVAVKNPLVMQIYADVLGRTMQISSSSQTCALGSAIAAAVLSGAFPDFDAATARLASPHAVDYRPVEASRRIYDELYRLYKQLHDAFGDDGAARAGGSDLYNVMKDLLAIKEMAHG